MPAVRPGRAARLARLPASGRPCVSPRQTRAISLPAGRAAQGEFELLCAARGWSRAFEPSLRLVERPRTAQCWHAGSTARAKASRGWCSSCDNHCPRSFLSLQPVWGHGCAGRSPLSNTLGVCSRVRSAAPHRHGPRRRHTDPQRTSPRRRCQRWMLSARSSSCLQSASSHRLHTPLLACKRTRHGRQEVLKRRPTPLARSHATQCSGRGDSAETDVARCFRVGAMLEQQLHSLGLGVEHSDEERRQSAL